MIEAKHEFNDMYEVDVDAFQGVPKNEGALEDAIPYNSSEMEVYSAWICCSENLFILSVCIDLDTEHVVPIISYLQRNDLKYVIKLSDDVIHEW